MYFFDLTRVGGGANQSSINTTQIPPQSIYLATVLSVDDGTDGGKIYAKINKKDNSITGKTDPMIGAFPLLPKYLNVMPMEGELVFIFIEDVDMPNGNRFWIGPIISQPQYLPSDTGMNQESGLKRGGLSAPKVAPSKIPANNGVYPKKNEIAFQGRENADLVFRNAQAILRAGKYNKDIPAGTTVPIFNRKHAYFKLADQVQYEANKTGSIATIVAEKLLFLTFDGRQNNFKEYKLTEPNVELTQESLVEILSKGEPAVYGYVLLELVKLLKEAMFNHVHPYHGLPTCPDETIVSLANFNLENILAKNIRLV